MQQHVYTSSKGESFLSWHQWALATLSGEDLALYLDTTNVDPLSPEKIILYKRWIEEEQIKTHVVIEDGETIQTAEF